MKNIIKIIDYNSKRCEKLLKKNGPLSFVKRDKNGKIIIKNDDTYETFNEYECPCIVTTLGIHGELKEYAVTEIKLFTDIINLKTGTTTQRIEFRMADWDTGEETQQWYDESYCVYNSENNIYIEVENHIKKTKK